MVRLCQLIYDVTICVHTYEAETVSVCVLEQGPKIVLCGPPSFEIPGFPLRRSVVAPPLQAVHQGIVVIDVDAGAFSVVHGNTRGFCEEETSGFFIFVVSEVRSSLSHGTAHKHLGLSVSVGQFSGVIVEPFFERFGVSSGKAFPIVLNLPVSLQIFRSGAGRNIPLSHRVIFSVIIIGGE